MIILDQFYQTDYMPLDHWFVQWNKVAFFWPMSLIWLSQQYSICFILFWKAKKTIMLPTTNQVITAAESFRFFATQNGAGYAGRKELPSSLRSRFTEVHFQDFSKEEIQFIIENRSMVDLKPSMQQEVIKNASKLASAYNEINKDITNAKRKTPLFGAGVKMTMREILKWIKRKSVYPLCDWAVIGFQMFYTRVQDINILRLENLLIKAFPDSSASQMCKPDIIVDRVKYRLVNKK